MFYNIGILSCIPCTVSAFNYLENNYPFVVYQSPFLLYCFLPFGHFTAH